jgi:hypothetical protein
MTKVHALVMMGMDEYINRFTLLGGEAFCQTKCFAPVHLI